MSSDQADLEAELLQRLRTSHDPEAADELLRLLYEDLRRIARARLHGLPASITLRTTALVNESYLKLVAAGGIQCADREHFLARSACAMRSIVVDHVRARNRKRCCGSEEIPVDGIANLFQERYGDLLALNEAMNKLSAIDPRAAKVVELRFFADCSVQETAVALGISKRSVERDWTTARAYLAKELR